MSAYTWQVVQAPSEYESPTPTLAETKCPSLPPRMPEILILARSSHCWLCVCRVMGLQKVSACAM